MLRINEKAGIRREGVNLYSTTNIDYTEAILGTVIKVIVTLPYEGSNMYLVVELYRSCVT